MWNSRFFALIFGAALGCLMPGVLLIVILCVDDIEQPPVLAVSCLALVSTVLGIFLITRLKVARIWERFTREELSVFWVLCGATISLGLVTALSSALKWLM